MVTDAVLHSNGRCRTEGMATASRKCKLKPRDRKKPVKAKQKKETLRIFLIIPLSLTILILLGTCVIALNQLHKHYVNKEVRKSVDEVSQLFQAELEEDAGLLKAIIGFLQKDKNLQDSWLAGDRQSLLGYASPIFEDIRSNHKVTHFYFHSLDQVNFLRVHKPERYGDHIDRFTMNQAAGSAKDAWGIELGPLGTFTLRYVYPWKIDGKLEGYIELGEEIEHIMPELVSITGTELLFVINKSYLNRAGWEQGMEMLGQTGNWDQYSDVIVIDSTMEDASSVIDREIQRHHDRHENFTFKMPEDRNYIGGFVPLYDAGDTEVGDIIVLKDITPLQASLSRLLINLILICSGVSIMLLVFFWQYITRIEQRVKLVKSLEFQNREMQHIVHTTSHDLRSPLTNIGGFSEELKYDCDHLLELLAEQGDERGSEVELLAKQNIPESLGFITAGVKKMSNLLDGLLQVSRVGTAQVNSESLDMDKIVRDVLAAMEYQIKENCIAVTVVSLPGCIGDKNMLDRVFTNLIGNAIKYSDPAKKGEIRISGKVEDGMSIYCVADNGIGIAPDHQEKVFEIFHRLDPDDTVGGEGLGLTIVTRILDRMDGRVWLESEPGKGSRFFVSMPTVQA